MPRKIEKKNGGEEMYSESYFEKALLPLVVRTCSDLNIYIYIRYCEKDMYKLFVM